MSVGETTPGRDRLIQNNGKRKLHELFLNVGSTRSGKLACAQLYLPPPAPKLNRDGRKPQDDPWHSFPLLVYDGSSRRVRRYLR
jgi:hypothetical protein